MKLRNVLIIVESMESLNRRWSNALKSKSKRTMADTEVISVPSVEVLGKVLSPPRMEILLHIPEFHPASINALAKALRRDFKNVYHDVQFLATLGLIGLGKPESGKSAKPMAKFKKIEVALAA